MKLVWLNILLLYFAINGVMLSQQNVYTLTKTPFSNDRYDEFAPVLYGDEIVFCINRNSGVTHYYSPDEKDFFKIYKVDSAGLGKRSSPVLFSKDIRTKLNDGPVTFSEEFDTIFFISNVLPDEKSNKLLEFSPKLGIYSAVMKKKRWRNIIEFKYNNKYYNLGYNITSPYFSSHEQRLYFASDKPGGYGGSDIYYSQYLNGDWEEPVNLGPKINTSGNEVFPFLNEFSELIFASDGHPGIGGKDIFISKFTDSIWLAPIRFEPPINSAFDDFGFIAFNSMEEGFFSSNREKSLDIYYYKSPYPQIHFASEQVENNFCIVTPDSLYTEIDTTFLKYLWQFGDGKSSEGLVVNHCYSDTGTYVSELFLIDRNTGKQFFKLMEINLKVKYVVQPFIKSSNYALTNEPISFEDREFTIPGFDVIDFIWDFGDGNRMSGEKVIHSFGKEGEMNVKLELILKSHTSNDKIREAVYKNLRICSSKEEIDQIESNNRSSKPNFKNLVNNPNIDFEVVYSADLKTEENQAYVTEVISSENQLEIKGSFFKNLQTNYLIKEQFDTTKNVYTYYVSPHLTLMSAFSVYQDVIKLGYDKARVAILSINDSLQIELLEIMRANGPDLSGYFDENGRFTANGYILLDRLIRYLKKYPDVRIEVAVHTDNSLPLSNSMQLSQERARRIGSYLLSRGISQARLILSGYGSMKPISTNNSESGRLLNNRLEIQVR